MTPKRNRKGFLQLPGLSAVVFLTMLPEVLGGASPPAYGQEQPLRGAPIDSPVQTNVLSAATVQARPKRPKPGSVQHRMVQYLVHESASAPGGSTFGGSSAKVIFSPSQLAALAETPLPPGYERLGFETLSAFPFEVTREVAEGTTKAVASTLVPRPSIPSEVKAWDDFEEIKMSLPPRFAERIDASAQRQGFIQADSYMAHLRWSEPVERQGSPGEVVEAVSRELESAG